MRKKIDEELINTSTKTLYLLLVVIIMMFYREILVANF